MTIAEVATLLQKVPQPKRPDRDEVCLDFHWPSGARGLQHILTLAARREMTEQQLIESYWGNLSNRAWIVKVALRELESCVAKVPCGYFRPQDVINADTACLDAYIAVDRTLNRLYGIKLSACDQIPPDVADADPLIAWARQSARWWRPANFLCPEWMTVSVQYYIHLVAYSVE